jgi:hypothetical protein
MPDAYPYPPIGAPLKLAVSTPSVSEWAPLKTRRGPATIPWLGHTDGHTTAPISSARSTFLRPNLHRKKIAQGPPPQGTIVPPPPPTVAAKVQGGVGGGDLRWRPRSKVGWGAGTMRVHLGGVPWQGTFRRSHPPRSKGLYYCCVFDQIAMSARYCERLGMRIHWAWCVVRASPT